MKDYKRILEGVVNIINTTENSDIGFTNICSYIGENCPKLKESEDERIRQFLIHEVTETSDKIMSYRNMNKKDVLKWLEKQGEQKPAWSEEDAKICGKCIDAASGYYSPEDKQIMKDWLRNLKERVQPQPKQEWSEEDEETLKDIITSMTNLKDSATSDALRWIYDSKINWLKSLRPQSHWKPSEEQKNALYHIVRDFGKDKSEDEMLLESLLSDLDRL